MSDDFPGVRWHGHWIVADLPEFTMSPTGFGRDLPPAEFSRVLFRRTFDLREKLDRAPLRVSADSRYLLSVNGAEVGRGPIRSQPRRLRYDEYDVSSHLVAGRNVISVLVTYYGNANSFWQPAASSGLMGRDAQLVLEARLGDEWLVTDERWRAYRSPAWRAFKGHDALTGVPVELLDARELDPSWATTDFDDSGWTTASLVKASHHGGLAESRPPVDPYGSMLPRGIGTLGGERVSPVTAVVQTAPLRDDLTDHPAERVVAQLAVAGTPTPAELPLTVSLAPETVTIVTFDFQRIVAGHVELGVDAPAGARLDLFYQEAEFDATTGPVASAPRTSASYTARGVGDHYKAIDINGLRRISLMLPAGDGEIQVRDIAVDEYHYPFAGGARFESSDAELTRLYRAGIRTTEMNSFDAFTDCPTREQRAWVGDGVVHQMVHLVANEDWRLARNYIALGASPRSDGMLPMTVVGEAEFGGGFSIPDWALHWIHGVWNLYRHDGDREATLEQLPVVERILRWYANFVDEHGTISDVPEWNLIDWSSVFSSARSSLITGLWARGLREYAEMSDWVGNTASATWARGLHQAAQVGFEDFWDEERGSYVDHIVEGERKPAMSQAAGATAIVSGLAPRERWARIVDVITDSESLVIRSWIGGADGGYDMQKIVEQASGIYRIDWDAHTEIVLAEPFFSYVVHDAVALGGAADRLPDLLRRWSVFLQSGYDTFGECWGWGTPVHAWSATPTKDLIWYVLGVTPGSPGYETARIAPRPGRITQLSGSVPTPYGLLHVDVDNGIVRIDSPVPFRFVDDNSIEYDGPAGKHEFTLTTSGKQK
ncbi:alpha-L-rhamnosidase-like protein [Kribbella sp. VKM Ac-2527]|uniref:Alpha-L-rhamnosidase-like protein n=1 Tax=Kribbella caucasensis TaxID=2512215 RepID=A0A4R6KPY4_9ACTN|nr:alpha-L-rhamnosidase N-terminal domain-containing protein [Kribbella sp. VKM Ac-2527]TDO51669.1 alpha-L-rhamnosidase-like protein [Kribbella sp. VKM Ac-2527]